MREMQLERVDKHNVLKQAEASREILTIDQHFKELTWL
jgi:hypothetical protein